MALKPDKGAQLGRLKLKRCRVSTNELAGLVDPNASTGSKEAAMDQLLSALSERFGVPPIDLRHTVIPTRYLQMISRDHAIKKRILPLFAREDRLLVAMSDPQDKHAIAEMSEIAGMQLDLMIALEGPLLKTIARAFEARDSDEEYWVGDEVPASFFEERGLPDPRRTPREASSRFAVEEAVPQTSQPRHRLICIDDDERRLQSLRRQLEGLACEVETLPVSRFDRASLGDDRKLLIAVDRLGSETVALLSWLGQLDHKRFLVLVPRGRGWRFAEDLQLQVGRMPYRLYPTPPEALDAWLGVEDAEDRAKACLKQASELFRSASADEAVRFLEAEIRDGLCQAPVFVQLALLLAQQQDHARAIDALEWALIADPSHFAAAKNLAVLHERRSQRNQALDAWALALCHAPDEKVAKGIRAHIVETLNKSQEPGPSASPRR